MTMRSNRAFCFCRATQQKLVSFLAKLKFEEPQRPSPAADSSESKEDESVSADSLPTILRMSPSPRWMSTTETQTVNSPSRSFGFLDGFCHRLSLGFAAFGRSQINALIRDHPVDDIPATGDDKKKPSVNSYLEPVAQHLHRVVDFLQQYALCSCGRVVLQL